MRGRHFPVALAAVLAGCSAGPDYARPVLPPSPAVESGKFVRAADLPAAAPLAPWWQALDDPALDRLIATGLENAPTIAMAEAHARQARAGLAGARAALRPHVGASAVMVEADLPKGSFGNGAGDTELFLAGFDARWEIDLWGGRARAVEQRRAEADAADARLGDAQLRLTADIARTYVEMRRQESVVALLTSREALEQRASALAEQRFHAGTIPRQPVEATRQRQVMTIAAVTRAESEGVALRDALAVLTGAAPGTLDALPAAPVPLPPAETAVGDPAAMLARRPDVRAAERRLAAATAAIGVQQARRFPAISLLGMIGIGGTSAGDLFEPSRLASIAAPRLSWNFLDFGRTAASVRGAEAARDAALAEYRGNILAALQDAEATLVRFGAMRTGFAQASAATAHARAIARLQGQRVQAGTLSAGDALEADIAGINAQIAEAESRAAVTSSYIALSKALGLGWNVDATPR